MAKPTVLPRWALNDIVNATSGENNVVAPPAGYDTLGWDFKEKPPRQYFNWLGRTTHDWLAWLQEQTEPIGKFSASTVDMSGSPSYDFEYRRQFGVVHLTIPFMSGTAVASTFQFLAALPVAIRPSGTRLCGITGGVADFGGGQVVVYTGVLVDTSGNIKFIGAEQTGVAPAGTWPATLSRNVTGVTVTYTLSLTP
jgi:hypothetical protein